MIDSIAQNAAGLSKAQREAVKNGLYRATWPTIKALEKRGLVKIRTCFPDGQGLGFTPLGLAVREHLQRHNGGGVQ